MIEFPETAWAEWKAVADEAKVDLELRARIERGTLVEREVERLRIKHLASLQHQQELDADTTPELEMTTLAQYQASPALAPADLVEGVMKNNGLMIFLGPSGAGKTTTALQVLNSVLTGEDFLGQAVDQIKGSVGILSYDMDAALVQDWMVGFPNIDPMKVSIVNAYKRGNPLNVPAQRKRIADAWRAMETDVVLLDSFSASFFGHDQNDAAAVMAHYRDMKQFALTEVGARGLITIVHSTESNPEKARGSTVHHDVADTIITQWKDAKTDERHIKMVKYRAARGQKEMTPVIIGAPDPVTHLVDLDIGAMTLAGMHLPASRGAEAFPEMPDTYDEPDTDSDSGEEDDL